MSEASSSAERRGSSIHAYLDHDRRAHEAFAESRRRVYVVQPEPMAELDRFVSDVETGRGILVTGDSGAGKSSLLANWAHAYHRRSPDAFLIEYYIGATATHGRHAELIRRIIAEIAVRYGLDTALPSSAEELVESFPEWLAKIQAEKLVIVVDALNELREEAPGLTWLPEYLHSRIRIVASSSSEETAELLADRGWGRIEVTPLSSRERIEVANRYLDEHEARVSPEYLERVVAVGPTANPLFLRTSLAEIRGRANEPADASSIEGFLEASGLDDLMQRVLARAEREHAPSIVASVLSSIGVSHRGLTSEELAAVAHAGIEEIESVCDGLEFHLIEVGGLRSFVHETFRKGVESRYLAGPGAAETARRALIAALTEAGAPGRVDELLWQLRSLGEWEALAGLFSAPATLQSMRRAFDIGDALVYWSDLRSRFEMAGRIVEAAERSLGADASRDADLLESAGNFLFDVGELEAAARLLERALELRRSSLAPDDPALLHCQIDVARLHAKRGNHDEARTLLKEAIDVQERTGIADELLYIDALEAICSLHIDRREFAEARPYGDEALARVEALGERRAARLLPKYLGLVAAVAVGLEEYGGAGELLKRAETICEQLFGLDHPATAEAISNLGTVYFFGRDFEKASDSFARAISIWRELIGEDYPPIAVAQGNLGYSLLLLERFDDGLEHFRQAWELDQRSIGADHPATIDMQTNFSAALRMAGRFVEAEAVQVDACRRLERVYGADHLQYVQAQLDLAFIRFERGEIDAARDGYREYLPRKVALLGADNPGSVHSAQRYSEIIAASGGGSESDHAVLVALGFDRTMLAARPF